jgi:hypothetical protein
LGFANSFSRIDNFASIDPSLKEIIDEMAIYPADNSIKTLGGKIYVKFRETKSE